MTRQNDGAPLRPCQVYKLQVVAAETDKVPEMIPWCIAKVNDMCRVGIASPGEVTVRALKDGAGGNKGLVDLFVLKKRLLMYYLKVEDPKRVGEARQEKVKYVFQSYESYRGLFKPYPLQH